MFDKLFHGEKIFENRLRELKPILDRIKKTLSPSENYLIKKLRYIKKHLYVIERLGYWSFYSKLLESYLHIFEQVNKLLNRMNIKYYVGRKDILRICISIKKSEKLYLKLLEETSPHQSRVSIIVIAKDLKEYSSQLNAWLINEQLGPYR